MATKLSVYQGAIRLFGDARLDVITDDTESRYAMDDAWDGVVAFCLRAAAWRFALVVEALAPGAPTIPGFAISYPHPANWLRTHALFIMSGSHERPIDIREYGASFHSNYSGVLIRFVSSAFSDPSVWTENFTKAVEAYLAFQVADRLTNSAAAGQRMSGIFGVLMQEATLHDAQPEDPWLRFQLDGTLLRGAEYVLGRAAWRFALVVEPLFPDVSAITGFRISSLTPANWLRTHSLFIMSGSHELPVDIREYGTKFYYNYDNVLIRFVSADFVDPMFWPEHFTKVLETYLALQTVDRTKADDAVTEQKIFEVLLQEAILLEAEPEDPWLRFQLDGTLLRGMEYVLGQGYWAHATKTIEMAAQPVTAPPVTLPGYYPPTPPLLGYPYSYPRPLDMLTSHAFYVPAGDGREYPIDFKETAEEWSTHAPYVVVRYISRDQGLQPDLLPETFWMSVRAYLEDGLTPSRPPQPGQPAPVKRYETTLLAALATDGEAENPWYRFQRSGAFLRACFHVAETGRWKFAINTVQLEADAWIENDFLNGTLPANVYGDGSISPSYSAVFAKPNDWLRTVWIYRIQSQTRPGVDLEGWPERHDIDYRDELGNWHTNWRHIDVRYVRRAAVESWRWPQSYADAVLAWLEFDESRQDPKQTQVAAAKRLIYQDAVEKAIKSDDMEERPPYRHVGHIVRGRFYRSRGIGAQDFLGSR